MFLGKRNWAYLEEFFPSIFEGFCLVLLARVCVVCGVFMQVCCAPACRGQSRIAGAFLFCSLPYFCKTGSLIGSEARLAEQWALGIHLSSTPNGEHANMPHTCRHVLLFTWILGFEPAPYVCTAITHTYWSISLVFWTLFFYVISRSCSEVFVSVVSFCLFWIILIADHGVHVFNSITPETEADISLRPAQFLVSQGYTMRHCLKQKQKHINISFFF